MEKGMEGVVEKEKTERTLASGKEDKEWKRAVMYTVEKVMKEIHADWEKERMVERDELEREVEDLEWELVQVEKQRDDALGAIEGELDWLECALRRTREEKEQLERERDATKRERAEEKEELQQERERLREEREEVAVEKQMTLASFNTERKMMVKEKEEAVRKIHQLYYREIDRMLAERRRRLEKSYKVYVRDNKARECESEERIEELMSDRGLLMTRIKDMEEKRELERRLEKRKVNILTEEKEQLQTLVNKAMEKLREREQMRRDREGIAGTLVQNITGTADDIEHRITATTTESKTINSWKKEKEWLRKQDREERKRKEEEEKAERSEQKRRRKEQNKLVREEERKMKVERKERKKEEERVMKAQKAQRKKERKHQKKRKKNELKSNKRHMQSENTPLLLEFEADH